MTKVSDIPVQAGLPVSTAKQSVSTNDDKNKDFLEMMAMSSDVSPFAQADTRNKNDLGSTNGSDFLDFNVSDSSKANRIERPEDTSSKPAISKEDTKKVKDAVEAYEKDVKSAIKEELNVSDEEIEAAMETLGITCVDLTDSSNMAKLVGMLNGSEDAVNLLTNSSFTNLIEEVGNLFDELKDLTGLDMAEINEISQVAIDVESLGMEVLDTPVEMEVSIEPVASNIETKAPVISENIAPQEQSDENEIPDKEVEEAPVDMLNKDEKANASSAKMDNTSGDSASQNQGSKQPGEAIENNSTVRTESNVSFQQVNAETIEVTPEVNSYVSVDTQNVIEQIVSAARTQITATVRTMELELNPMNLGRMLMQVTEENGQITARIFTQNEAVKEALEAQMALLKDQLSEQGIKVEAVEISVATHEFEQNLEEGQDGLLQDELAHQQEEENKQARRGIHLGDPELMGDEPLSEEDELTARIMKDEGNMVNFRA